MLQLNHHVTTTAHRQRKYNTLPCVAWCVKAVFSCRPTYVPHTNIQHTLLTPWRVHYRTLRLKVLARYWLCMVFVIALTWSDRDLTKSLSTWLFCLKAPQSSGSLTLDWAQTLSQSKSRCAFHSPRWPPFMFPAVATSSTSLFSFAALVCIALHWFCLRALESAF